MSVQIEQKSYEMPPGDVGTDGTYTVLIKAESVTNSSFRSSKFCQ